MFFFKVEIFVNEFATFSEKKSLKFVGILLAGILPQYRGILEKARSTPEHITGWQGPQPPL